jgi:rhodanese-related sulfurtransferase
MSGQVIARSGTSSSSSSSSSSQTVSTNSQLQASWWRVVSRRPLVVKSEVDEKKGNALADLMPGERVSLLDHPVEQRPDSSVRMTCIDPVWMGWVTVTTKAGVVNLVRIEEGEAAAAATTSGEDAASAPSPAPSPAPAAVDLSDDTQLVLVAAVEQMDVNSSAAADIVDADAGTSSGGDPHVATVMASRNAYVTLGLPVALTNDLSAVRKAYRRISLLVHPDKCADPMALAAFRKLYGAFESLCDLPLQQRLYADLQNAQAREALSADLEEIQAAVDRVGKDDDDDDDDKADEAEADGRVGSEWWREASLADMAEAAEEADGADMDALAASQASVIARGGSVDDVGWVAARKAMRLQTAERAIFIDCREADAYKAGHVPGAFHVPLSAALKRGVVETMGRPLLDALLTSRKHTLVVIYSQAATPFSRCRALCRLLLYAGHQTLHPLRCKRLRGGMVGWTRRGGKVAS